MAFAYRAEQIIEIVKWRKVPRISDFLKAGEPVPFQELGDKGRRIDVLLDLVEGPLLYLRFRVPAPVFDNTETYDVVLLLSGQRIRGIGWLLIGRRRFYRQTIPLGWHENILCRDSAARKAATLLRKFRD